ncbi:hypothetical protein Tsubulata_016295 [Turnera subulata]|uniref:DUF4005 domain-containing protein n=1 Tax=Turnera subulata TaxID=218843 RepID=A0A9Q0G9N5_9ROSI|nr:hypothetical protein Tsubulata_016295 [Turnera subulata]
MRVELGNDKKMGRKGKWFASVKKAFSPNSKRKKEQKLDNSEKKPFVEQHQLDPDTTSSENVRQLSPPPQPEELKLVEVTNEHNNHAYSPPLSTDIAAEPEVTAPQTTVEVVHLAKPNKYAGKSKEELAAIKIQTAFRGYMSRRALRALRGLVRLKSLMEGPTVKRQATHTLRCMQTLARVQSQINLRRIRMQEENQALQKQLLQKHAKELESLRMGEEWDDSLQSKEQIEANLLSKFEAAMRRERAMAYSFSHQQTWKNNSKSANPMFMNPGNPSWGWSWLERWIAAHPWESKSATEKGLNNDHSSVKSASRGSIGGEISKSFARYQLNSDKLSPKESERPNQTAVLNTPPTPKPTTVARKLKSASPRSSFGGPDDDARSIASMQSVGYRRYSIAGSSVRDDESLVSSSTVPSYMVPTESARAKSRLQSPLGAEKNGTPEKEKVAMGSAKKRLAYPPSPAKPRRHSGPPKLESNFSEVKSVTNGDGI